MNKSGKAGTLPSLIFKVMVSRSGLGWRMKPFTGGQFTDGWKTLELLTSVKYFRNYKDI